jgi:hypothetical protein
MMNKRYLIFVLAIAACTTSKRMSMQSDNQAAAKDDGWITLFDGKSINGWHIYGKPGTSGSWQLENGALHLVKKEGQGEGGDLITDNEFANFKLKLDWKIAPKGNSGIIFYVNEDAAKFPNTYNTGPEMQVLDNGTPTKPGHPDARLYTHRAGDLYDLLASKDAAKPAGEWNQVEVVSDKGKLDFYMNGVHTLSTTMWDENWRQMIAISKFKDMAGFGTFKKGKIALQDHGNEVWFRDIKIKEL